LKELREPNIMLTNAKPYEQLSISHRR